MKLLGEYDAKSMQVKAEVIMCTNSPAGSLREMQRWKVERIKDTNSNK